MNKADIHFALDWLSWRLFAHNRKYSLEYLDKMATKKLHEAVSSPHTSMAVKVLAQNGILSLKQAQKPGTADKSCNAMCKKIVQDADEEDFLSLLANNTRKIPEWRKLWNTVRSNRMHRI